MIDPYKMVFINLIACILVLFSVLFYKLIFPNKKINYLYVLILISLLPCMSLLRTGAYESGDFNIHVRRSMEFYKILSEGNLLPSWAGDFNAGYGYPLFTFNYILPYYIVSIIHFLGFSFIVSFKIFLGINLILSSIFMYFFGVKYFKNNLAAFTCSISYLFTPYHLISVHFKSTAGEILVITLLPLFFYFLYLFLINNKYIYLYCTIMVFTLIIISHIYIAFFLIPLILLFIYKTIKNKINSLIFFTIILSASLLLSSFQWTAPIIYKKFLFINAFQDDFKNLYYPSIKDLLFAPWRAGLLFQGPKGELSFLIGYTQLLTFIISLYFVFSKKYSKNDKQWVLLWSILLFILIFMITPYSKIVWEYLPNIRDASSHRLLILVGFICSILFGFIARYLKNKLFLYLLIIFTIILTILNWGQRRVIPSINDNILRSNLSKGYEWGDTHFYANSKWVDAKEPWFTSIPTQKIMFDSKGGSYEEIIRKSTLHVYNVKVKKNSKIKENTLYFPDWKIYANGKQINSFPDNKGIINFYLKKGQYYLIVKYEQIPSYTFIKKINLISLLIFILLFFSLIIKRIYLKPHKFK